MTGKATTRAGAPAGGPGESGSALVVAVLVLAVLTLLGLSFLLMADTESRIAENERLSAQALYFAESGARMVKRWFDGPGSPANLANPPVSIIDRTRRTIDEDGDPVTAPHAQDGGAWPRYKQGIDLDADGADDVFDRPYRGGLTREEALANTLLGTESGPDMRIAEETSAAAAAFLAELSRALAPDFPSAAPGLEARIARIDVYGPPCLRVAGAWRRFGVATVRVTARICRRMGSTDRTLAERSVRAVLSEIPYPRPLGPLVSCNGLRFRDAFNVRWGAAIVTGPAEVAANWEAAMSTSIPRAVPRDPRIDFLHGRLSPDEDATWAQLEASLEAGADIADPWFRFLGGGPVSNWASEPSPQVRTPSTTGQDHSNLFQNLPGIPCPDLDYDLWKAVALAGGDNVHYFSWAGGTDFREDGAGTPADFETLTEGRTGFFFFDTRDGRMPSETLDPEGLPVNLTPGIRVRGSGFGVRGLLYLNSREFAAAGAVGVETRFEMPAEPFRDVNGNGLREASEPWINLDFGGLASMTSPIRGSATDDYGNPGGGAVHNAAGPSFAGKAVLDGVLYTNGAFASEGDSLFFGSVVAKGGAKDSAGTSGIYWNNGFGTAFPPAGWGLPRVLVTRWESDLP